MIVIKLASRKAIELKMPVDRIFNCFFDWLKEHQVFEIASVLLFSSCCPE